ncbi:hypothetical protein J2X53_003201 [Pseudorhodobacter sp. 4114]|nr:hypothetical protein [Pseudorhodobacter sp. 4114]
MMIAALPVHAGWETTQWGMSPDEALAALESAVGHDPTPEEYYQEGGNSYAPLVTMPHGIDGIRGQVSLLFDSGNSLRSVLFNPDDIAECDALHAAITQQHGAPDAMEPGWISIADWVVGADAIKLTNMASARICNLSYAPA